MKKLILMLVAVFSLSVMTSCGDEDIQLPDLNNIPSTALDYLKKTYENSPVKWSIDKERLMFKATMTVKGEEVNVYFTVTGNLYGTERVYTGELPEAVKNYLNTNYADYTVAEVHQWILATTQTYYEVTLKADGKTDVKVKVDNNGKAV